MRGTPSLPRRLLGANRRLRTPPEKFSMSPIIATRRPIQFSFNGAACTVGFRPPPWGAPASQIPRLTLGNPAAGVSAANQTRRENRYQRQAKGQLRQVLVQDFWSSSLKGELSLEVSDRRTNSMSHHVKLCQALVSKGLVGLRPVVEGRPNLESRVERFHFEGGRNGSPTSASRSKDQFVDIYPPPQRIYPPGIEDFGFWPVFGRFWAGLGRFLAGFGPAPESKVSAPRGGYSWGLSDGQNLESEKPEV